LAVVKRLPYGCHQHFVGFGSPRLQRRPPGVVATALNLKYPAYAFDAKLRIMFILRHSLSAADAMVVERVGIDFSGFDSLSNSVRGKYPSEFGRADTQELIRRYDTPPFPPKPRCSITARKLPGQK
jgi:hypothetical protein